MKCITMMHEILIIHRHCSHRSKISAPKSKEAAIKAACELSASRAPLYSSLGTMLPTPSRISRGLYGKLSAV